jgi:diaminohydroxyphosphoribosylaminopyrimidine deaminase/5-amino-6-(5-phosphoribosylamino)uracil reductase
MATGNGRATLTPFSQFSRLDEAMMRRALALAERGLYTATPNPRVGCVLAKGDKIVGEGWHERAAGPHAEANALAAAGPEARGASAYVSLEPCSHQGRTPPCAAALARAGVVRVVAAIRDPNPAAARGGDALGAAGIRFEAGLMEAEARELNIGFFARMERGRPWVRVKIAATLDGRTALADGRSQWLTGIEARRDGHRWRARACAVLTGAGTVRADDPRLTVREIETPRQPLRVVVDSRLDTPSAARILEGGSTLVFCAADDPARRRALEASGAEVVVLPNARGKVELPAMLAELARREINELHVEAGFRLNGSLVREGCVDEFLVYLNPSFLGDAAQGMLELAPFASLEERLRLRLLGLERLGEDLRILARFV